MDVVVVGVDGSGNSRQALRAAVLEASWRNAKVHAVHAVHYPPSFGISLIDIDLETIRDVGRASLDEEIALLEEEYPDGLPVAIETSIPLGHVGMAIQSVNDESDDDTVLTVVGSRGMGGLIGPLVGSVTTYLVHHLDGPLLVVPPDGISTTETAAKTAEVLA